LTRSSDPAIDLLSSCVESDPAHRPADAGVLAELVQKLPHSLSMKAADAASQLPLAEAASSVFQKPSPPPRKIKAEPVPTPTPTPREFAPPPGTERKPPSPAPRAQRQVAPAVSARPEPFLGWFNGSRRWVAAGLLGLAGLLGVIVYIATDKGTIPESITTQVGQIKLKRIPAGTFLMGSSEDDKDAYVDEKPQHRVRIRRPFYLGVHEISQAEYQAVVGNNPSWFSATGGGKDKIAGQAGDRHPVEMVSWLDAGMSCR
jgi:Sulfatase-modifying factor enzyme 1